MGNKFVATCSLDRGDRQETEAKSGADKDWSQTGAQKRTLKRAEGTDRGKESKVTFKKHEKRFTACKALRTEELNTTASHCPFRISFFSKCFLPNLFHYNLFIQNSGSSFFC